MSKLLMLKGLPASGKSTYAKELVAKGWKRVNKDDLRAMIDDGKWSRGNEHFIVNQEEGIVRTFLNAGLNVVVDDTNFAHDDRWFGIAVEHKADFEVKFFDVPFMECIERDAKRGDKAVGSKVIYRMYEQYLKPEPIKRNPELRDCYIFDIDGTLANKCDRSPYDYTKVSGDKEFRDVSRITQILNDVNFNYDIIIVSGRDGSCSHETNEWLKENGIYFSELWMRDAGDKRKDSIVKQEIYEKYIKGKYNVLGVFDDRNQVVEMWRSLGLTCFQVAYGYF